jgi:hypothetical protein
MNAEFMHGNTSEFDSKTSGRWSKEEHEKFIEGKQRFLFLEGF